MVRRGWDHVGDLASFQKDTPAAKTYINERDAGVVGSGGNLVKIVMMGSGGLGGYFDARLAAVGADVHFVAPTPISTPCGRRA